MSVALRGNLRDFGIADVFQLIGQQRKTGVLEFKRDEQESVQIRFDRGAVVFAAPVANRADEALAEMLVRCGRLSREQVDSLTPECVAAAQTVPRLAVSRGWLTQPELERIEDLLTRETIFEVLRWENGEFDFRAQAVDHGRMFASLLGAEQILMDALRMVDEWHSFAGLVPEDAVFQRVAGFAEFRQRTELEPARQAEAERIYQLVDGRSPVHRVVDRSLLGRFDAVRLLADLRRCEVIEPVEGALVRRREARPLLRLGAARAEIAPWIASCLPLVLLAVLFATAVGRGQAGDPPPGIPLERGGSQAVRAAHEAERLRRAVEVHRFSTGRWPAELSELAQAGLASADELAPSGERPYYYAVREGGALLLAPQR
jgi:hypothetical protein